MSPRQNNLMEENMSNKLPQNYVELLSSYPKIKDALEEYEYDEAVLIETDWEGNINNPQTLDSTLGQVEDEDGHWLDGLIEIVGGEPDYYELARWFASPRDKLRMALVVLRNGDSGLEAMTYSNIDLNKCHEEVLKSLDYFNIPREVMNNIDIGEMEWNREADLRLGSGWAGKIVRKF
jgi:hypothetical protein